MLGVWTELWLFGLAIIHRGLAPLGINFELLQFRLNRSEEFIRWVPPGGQISNKKSADAKECPRSPGEWFNRLESYWIHIFWRFYAAVAPTTPSVSRDRAFWSQYHPILSSKPTSKRLRRRISYWKSMIFTILPMVQTVVSLSPRRLWNSYLDIIGTKILFEISNFQMLSQTSSGARRYTGLNWSWSHSAKWWKSVIFSRRSCS